MRRLCYLTVLLLVCRVNARPYDWSDEPDPLESVAASRRDHSPLNKQFDREDLDKSMLDERAERLILNGYNSDKLADTGQETDDVAFPYAEVAEVEAREKRSDYDDAQLDADIKRYQDILAETGKSLESGEGEGEQLADDERRDETIESSGRLKRSASDDSLDEQVKEEEDDSQDNDNAKEEDDDDNRNNKESEEIADESETIEEKADEVDNDERNEETDENCEESDDADVAEIENDADEQDSEKEEEDVDDDSFDADNEKEVDLEDSLDEVKSLDEYLEGLNAETDQLAQLRDNLNSILKVEYSPEDASRSRRETLKMKRIAQENPVDYLKSLPQYKDVPRQVLTNAVHSMMKSGEEEQKSSAVEEVHEPQPVERQAARVAKCDTPSLEASAQTPAPPCPGASDLLNKGPETKEEKELDKVIDMRKAQEAIVAKEQDDVIKAEHLAHTMQEDLHDVMREIRALKVEINAERKDAEKVSIETKEAQQDLEMHDERKYNARRKVDELYMRLTDLEADTCDNRNKRRALKRFVADKHHEVARRRRTPKDKKEHQEVALAGTAMGHDQASARQGAGESQQTRKVDEIAIEVPGSAADPQAAPREACTQACQDAAASETKKKDEQYNEILQEIIIGEAQVKVEDVQVARAEEEAVSLHRRLSNVLSKLAALSIEMKNLQTQAQMSGKRARQAQTELAYHDQVIFTARKKVNAARNLESELQRAITDQRMNVKGQCSTKCPAPK